MIARSVIALVVAALAGCARQSVRYDASAPGLSCDGRRMVEIRNGSSVRLRTFWVPPGWRLPSSAQAYILGEAGHGVSRFEIRGEGYLYWERAEGGALDARSISWRMVCEVRE